MDSSEIEFNELDRTFSVANIAKGISGFQGVFLRGPVGHNDDNEITRNFGQLKKKYGGFINNSQAPLLAYRALDGGAFLRVSGVRHYSDVTDASTLTALKARLPIAKVLTFSAALITANVYNVTINGSAIAPVTFTTSNDNTLSLIATAIEALTAVKRATVIPVTGTTSDDRSILIEPADDVETLTITGSAVTSGSSQATTTNTNLAGIYGANGVALFILTPKYPGADYNNLVVTISAASNGDSSYFNLAITHLNEPDYNESYANLKVTNTNVSNSTYLTKLKTGSSWVDVSYLDLSGQTTQQRPYNGTYQFIAGDDGDAIVVTDYIGDASAGTGLHAFNDYSDMMQVAAPEISDVTLHTAGADYANTRKDLLYWGHLDNSLTTESTIVAERVSTNVDTSYCMFFAGGLKVKHPVTNEDIEISELADIMYLASNNDTSVGEYRSFAGTNRGVIKKAYGVVNNFGGKAKKDFLDGIANAQVNMVVSQNGKIYLKDDYTAQKADSQVSFANVRRLNIYIQKTLEPTLERYLKEPNTFDYWRQLFNEVEPFLISLKDKKALYEVPIWDGDQDKNSLADLSVNNATDVQAGKYKINFYEKPVPGINQIGFTIIMQKGVGVTFEDIQQ